MNLTIFWHCHLLFRRRRRCQRPRSNCPRTAAASSRFPSFCWNKISDNTVIFYDVLIWQVFYLFFQKLFIFSIVKLRDRQITTLSLLINSDKTVIFYDVLIWRVFFIFFFVFKNYFVNRQITTLSLLLIRLKYRYFWPNIIFSKNLENLGNFLWKFRQVDCRLLRLFLI